jgi:predicted RNase H-like HicB family nuclease
MQELRMLIYKAMYKTIDEGVHAEVLDFPGAISFGADLEEARRILASALVDMAETNVMHGEPLPPPDPTCTDPEADVEEPIYLLLSAATRAELTPRTIAVRE